MGDPRATCPADLGSKTLFRLHSPFLSLWATGVYNRSRIFCLQPGVEWKFLLRRTWFLGQKLLPFHSLSKGIDFP